MCSFKIVLSGILTFGGVCSDDLLAGFARLCSDGLLEDFASMGGEVLLLLLFISKYKLRY